MRSQPPLRVALIGPAPHHIGGTAATIELMLRHLPSLGVEVRAVATDTLPAGLPAALDRVRYLRTALRFLGYAGRLARAALWADVLHLLAGAYLNFLLEPLPALLIGRALGKRVVLNYHTAEAQDHLRRWRWLVAQAARRADAFVVPSAYLHRIFARARIDALVVPNIVEAPPTVGTPNGRLIVNTRALEPLYDIPTTLRAFALVQRAFPDARLVLVGAGSEQRRCRRLAAELGLRGAVRFVGGVPRHEVSRYLAQAAVFLNSSRIDNQPLSILEALAWGVPVVSTAAGGIGDIVRHGENGLLAPAGDHRTLAAHCCRVLGDPELARRLAQAGRAVAAAHTWQAVGHRWLQVYRGQRTQPAAVPPVCFAAHD